MKICGYFTGSPHEMLPLDELATSLVKVGIVAEMMAKEDKLEGLFKLTSKAISEYDNNTSDMVQLIKRKHNQVCITIVARVILNPLTSLYTDYLLICLPALLIAGVLKTGCESMRDEFTRK